MVMLNIVQLLTAILLVRPTSSFRLPVTDENLISLCDGILAGIVEHPTECSQFVNCYQQLPAVLNCPKEHIFSPRLIICVPGDHQTCSSYSDPPTTNEPPTTEPTTIEPTPEQKCEEIFFGVIPHPTICYKFIECHLGKAIIQLCPDDFIFYQKLTTCLPGDRDKCKIYDGHSIWQNLRKKIQLKY